MKQWRCMLGFFVFTCTLTTAGPADACYWDKDTLRMEKRRFPDTLELITGRFLRHSSAFYEWRIQDRRQILEGQPNHLPTLDDLAVALDKTNQHQEAISLMKAALALDPDRYETHANLGTFYIHAGQFEDGLVHIKRATAINPEAHFGREIVQQRLVEYVLMIRTSGRQGLPLSLGRCRLRLKRIVAAPERWETRENRPMSRNPCSGGFIRFVTKQGLDRKAAINGILGMMKFSNHTHPILLEALGDTLIGHLAPPHESKHADARRLAARAYLQASYQVEDADAKALYRAKAVLALDAHQGARLRVMESLFRRELRRGERYSARVEADETRWIRQGKNPEREFERVYYRRKKKATVRTKAPSPAPATTPTKVDATAQ